MYKGIRMKKLTIRQKLLDYILVANDKKIQAIFTLFKDKIKNSKYIFQNSERKIIATDLNKISWGNYITQEELQKIFEGREDLHKKNEGI